MYKLIKLLSQVLKNKTIRLDTVVGRPDRSPCADRVTATATTRSMKVGRLQNSQTIHPLDQLMHSTKEEKKCTVIYQNKNEDETKEEKNNHQSSQNKHQTYSIYGPRT